MLSNALSALMVCPLIPPKPPQYADVVQANPCRCPKPRFADCALNRARFSCNSRSYWNWRRPWSSAVGTRIGYIQIWIVFVILLLATPYRRHTRPVHGPVASLRVRWLPAVRQLSIPRRLRRSGPAIARNDMLAAGVQGQISRELLFAARQPRVCHHQSDIR